MADAAADGTGFYSIGYSGTAGEYGYNYYYGLGSAYACCVAGQNDPDGGQIWYWNFQGSGECEVYNDGGFSQCSQMANTWTIGTFQPIVPVVSNGPCGEFNTYNGDALG
ncbi:hypothetical protein LTR78_008166 [Recurvomyces mirabilis]|uniref:Uncharacterized protein n=1 Tax=Recurvomyces mirabilis TaxID=574656 RepID=A0AAE0TR60_9PEZI|nr:hypothetical protein LTR78_008166 [Recurvomyces mirabilis]KAK5150635.1 hypothetical protein LTS14_009918 [Recurvomyces mirabilis]